MSFKLTPITAKIQKTTKGGVTNPFIKGVGVPMKKSAVGKQTSSFTSAYEKRMAEKRQAAKQKRADAGKNRYNKKIDQYKQDVADLKNGTAKGQDAYARSRIKNFSNELFDYDTKNQPGSTKGYTPKSYLEAKANKTLKKSENPKEKKFKTINLNKSDFDFKKLTGDAGMKDAIKLANSSRALKDTLKDTVNDSPVNDPPKPTKITGKIGSDLRRKQYDAKGWAYDDTIKKPKPKPKAKAKETVKKAVDIKKAKTTSLETKLDTKNLKKQAVKNALADKKDSRAARVRQKGIDALASGDKKKALRLKKRETRIKNRANKKRGQASKAINPN